MLGQKSRWNEAQAQQKSLKEDVFNICITIYPQPEAHLLPIIGAGLRDDRKFTETTPPKLISDSGRRLLLLHRQDRRSPGHLHWGRLRDRKPRTRKVKSTGRDRLPRDRARAWIPARTVAS